MTNRPEVVAAIVRALLSMNAADVARLDELDHITPDERQAAVGLHAELLALSAEARDERLADLARQASEERDTDG